MRFYFVVTDGPGHEWIEYFDDIDKKTAMKEFKNLINNFNNTLREGEKKRTILCLTDQPITKAIKMDFDLKKIRLGRKIVGKHRALKLKEDKSVIAWIDAKKITKKEQLKDITDIEFEEIKFKCPGYRHTMNLETEYPYVDCGCKGHPDCPMLVKYANSSNYTCRLRKNTDNLYIIIEGVN